MNETSRYTCPKAFNGISNNVTAFIISMDFLIIRSKVKAAPFVAWVDIYSWIFRSIVKLDQTCLTVIKVTRNLVI